MTLSKLELSKTLTKVMTMGSGTNLPIVMSPSELAKLIAIIYCDTNSQWKIIERSPELWSHINPKCNDYYSIPLDWFEIATPITSPLHIEILNNAIYDIPDLLIYLKCLSEIHKRRKKYSKILHSQPMPEMVQISPRVLIEYGQNNPQALASWMTWRKFFYDLDNRAAQETGYLFEPILASALGGEQISAKHKIIRRQNDQTKGRQIDCWKILPDGTNLAYEFKLRVTIAASGQGRFGEEVQFAIDARLSNSIPVLLVLDPTMNHRLDDLKRAYTENGGHAFIGQEAWDHIEAEAGEVMSQFIEKYVRRPIEHISSFESNENTKIRYAHDQLLSLSVSHTNGVLSIGLGEHTKKIIRYEDESMREDGSND